jgi:hypothetical protein
MSATHPCPASNLPWHSGTLQPCHRLTHACSCSLVPPILCTLLLTAPLCAQEPASRWFPSRDYAPTLLGAPRDPVNVAKLVVNVESPNAYEPGLETEVGFGINLPVLLLAGDNLRNGLVVGVQGGVFARFSLHNVERDLIGTDWLITVPLVLHRGDHRFELEYFHTSSHLGDEYTRRFGLDGINYSRDAVRGMAHLQVASVVGIYGGGGWAYNVHPDDDLRWTVQAGVEFLDRASDKFASPYGAVDVQLEQPTDWKPRVNVQLGALFPRLILGRESRVAAEFLTGPSPQGQFAAVTTTHLTIGVYIQP